MYKFCVFCGEKPVDKNKEHIIPKWLISETGNLKRNINVGVNWRTKKTLSYSFDSFVFPACYDCNSKFSLLEGKVKQIYLKIDNDESLNQMDIDILLDWLDKVRVGLWLGYITLTSDFFEVQPHHFISTRVSNADRMVAIYKVNDSQKGIGFRGVNLPAFHYQPSCFGLIINNYYFLNISTHSLFSRRIGFPYITNHSYSNEEIYAGMVIGELQKGIERIMFPLLRKRVFGSPVELYQPILDKSMLNTEFMTRYVSDNTLDINNGKGKIYFQDRTLGSSFFLDNGNSILLDKLKKYNRFELEYLFAKQILEYQNLILDMNKISDHMLSKDERDLIKIRSNFSKKINKILLSRMKTEFTEEIIEVISKELENEFYGFYL